MTINEETGLYENYGLWHVPFWQTETFYLVVKICIGLAVLVACFFVYKLYASYRKKKKILPAWDVALQELQKLVADQARSLVSEKEFYLSISSIVKQYLHDRFGYDVLGKTDREIIVYLQNNKADKKMIEDVSTLLEANMVIKFAGSQADTTKMAYDYNLACDLVKQTIPTKNNPTNFKN